MRICAANPPEPLHPFKFFLCEEKNEEKRKIKIREKNK